MSLYELLPEAGIAARHDGKKKGKGSKRKRGTRSDRIERACAPISGSGRTGAREQLSPVTSLQRRWIAAVVSSLPASDFH